MKFAVVLVLSVMACVIAAPPGSQDQVQIARFENVHQPDNSYTFTYELTDGQTRNEIGTPKRIGEEEPIVVTGSFAFVGPDGKKYSVTYTADEFGYRPQVQAV